MQFTTIHQLLQEADEADKKKHTGSRKPHLDYEEVMVPKKLPKGTPKPPKGTPVEKVLDRVVVNLKAHQAGAFSRLTSRYERLDKVMKNMIEARDQVNDQVRAELEDLFDAEDEVLTRVVQTASWAITLSKATKGEDKEVKDYEPIIEGLMGLIDKSLLPKAEELVKAFTSVAKGKDTPTKLTVKPLDSKAEDLSEGVIKNVKLWLSNLVTKVKAWAKSFDREFADLKKQAAELGL
jgi:hypothetical protein